MRAIIDRIEEGIAVILLGEEEIPLHLPVHYLPNGTSEGSVLEVSISVIEDETVRIRSQMEERIARLRKKSSR